MWWGNHSDQADQIKAYLDNEGEQTYALEALEAIQENPDANLTFDFLLHNKNPYVGDQTTGDVDNNPEGGIDNTQYPDFNLNQQEWPTISNVIPVSDFIGWGHSGINENCMDYAKAQIAIKGYQISNYFNNNGQTIQIYTAQNGAGPQAVEDAISYLIYALENEIPVIVGVDAQSGSPNPQTDNTTDHFVVIVGMGEDESGKYFSFFDNASSRTPVTNYGASLDNKFYRGVNLNTYICRIKIFSYGFV